MKSKRRWRLATARLAARLLVCVVGALLLQGCSPSSLEEYRQEGQSVERALIKEIKEIRNRKQLVAAVPKLSRLFEKLVDVIIESREWQDSHPLAPVPPLLKKDHNLSETLRLQLVRLYQLQGGRELVEKCQRRALNRLDAYEQRRTRRQQL